MPSPQSQPQSKPLHKLLCVCHIVSYFNGQKWVCHLLCLFNLRYDEAQQSFAFGQQVLVCLAYTWCVWSGLGFVVLLPYAPCWTIDRYTVGAYGLPTIYCLARRRYLLRILNEMVRVHRRLQRAMGPLFCVDVKRAFCWALLVALELVATLYWEVASQEAWQIFFQLGFVLCWYLQILLHVNSYVWLQAIYVVMNQAFEAPLSPSQRWIMMGRLLRIQPRLRRIQRSVADCFSVHVLSAMVLVSFKFFVSFTTDLEAPPEGSVGLRFEVLHLRYLANRCLLIGSLFLVINDFQNERNRFLTSLWDMPQQICSLYRMHKRTLAVVDLMILSGNRPSDLRPTSAILWEIRIESKVKCAATMKSFVKYLLMLLPLVSLVPLVAVSNGFDLKWERYVLQNDTLASWQGLTKYP
ncbi:uncharacterized protein LOC108165348 [Drosophila miranda]|uniref:uncharacterized protein LOC108165348 n=1 Tax=Drosophila miranda TaxID=7229 RepID=UPI0007E63198|nr:uncharacterized protein LOC108165348 [Drosophila miranda]